MAMVGGSMVSLSLDGRGFSVAADADVSSKVGGTENELQMNGDSTGRLIKTAVGWALTGYTLGIDFGRGDDQFLQDLQNRNDFFPVVAQYASGAIRNGLGQITGETQTSSMNATATVDLMGPGELTLQ